MSGPPRAVYFGFSRKSSKTHRVSGESAGSLYCSDQYLNLPIYVKKLPISASRYAIIPVVRKMNSICSALRSLTRNPVQNRSSPRYCKADKVPACGVEMPRESLEQIGLNALRIHKDPSGKTGQRMKPSQDTCCRRRQDTMFGGNIGDVMDLRGHCRVFAANAPFFFSSHPV